MPLVLMMLALVSAAAGAAQEGTPAPGLVEYYAMRMA
jgi:hypothetical protein